MDTNSPIGSNTKGVLQTLQNNSFHTILEILENRARSELGENPDEANLTRLVVSKIQALPLPRALHMHLEQLSKINRIPNIEEYRKKSEVLFGNENPAVKLLRILKQDHIVEDRNQSRLDEITSEIKVESINLTPLRVEPLLLNDSHPYVNKGRLILLLRDTGILKKLRLEGVVCTIYAQHILSTYSLNSDHKYTIQCFMKLIEDIACYVDQWSIPCLDSILFMTRSDQGRHLSEELIDTLLDATLKLTDNFHNPDNNRIRLMNSILELLCTNESQLASQSRIDKLRDPILKYLRLPYTDKVDMIAKLSMIFSNKSSLLSQEWLDAISGSIESTHNLRNKNHAGVILDILLFLQCRPELVSEELARRAMDWSNRSVHYDTKNAIFGIIQIAIQSPKISDKTKTELRQALSSQRSNSVAERERKSSLKNSHTGVSRW